MLTRYLFAVGNVVSCYCSMFSEQPVLAECFMSIEFRLIVMPRERLTRVETWATVLRNCMCRHDKCSGHRQTSAAACFKTWISIARLGLVKNSIVVTGAYVVTDKHVIRPSAAADRSH